MSLPQLPLRAGREKSLSAGHPWLFSGAFAKPVPSALHGAAVAVTDGDGTIRATGSASAKGSIAVRIFARGEATLDQAFIAARLFEARGRRILAGLVPGPDAGYRLCFGEADGLPGLIVDVYADVAVFQSATTFFDLRRELVVGALRDLLGPRAIVEKSSSPSRKEEGLSPLPPALRHGADPGLVPFVENGVTYVADPMKGQKTGFFLDQRPLRELVRRYAKGRSVLNVFSYSGALGAAAMAGGATGVTNVDASAEALHLCEVTAQKNVIEATRFLTVKQDAFTFLGAPGEAFNMVIVDPPALIKSKKETDAGKKGYHFLNRAALRRVAEGGVFVTSSCSQHLSRDEFMAILARASLQAGKRLHYLGEAPQPADHPAPPWFPEGGYLKGFVYLVTGEAASTLHPEED
ncbi:MAG: class I SAM-dependent rRNA methyltransferase [Nitrospinae bacterium]|nr:class I SAM-dependent rRNA methyltransferase [Nitrospinota bacterium]